MKGVHWSAAKQRWVVRCVSDGKRLDLGQFKHVETARAARSLADAGDIAGARALYEVEKARNAERERVASLERLSERRARKIERDGHPYAMLYPHHQAMSGEVVAYKGQKFRCLGPRETVSGRAGHLIVVDVWRSHCATCGVPYTFQLLPKRDGQEGPFWPVRRCETHKKAGMAVSSAKLHRNAASLP